MSPGGVLFVVSGPSGVGKSTLLRAAMDRVEGLEFSVSATTRAPRAGERDGVDYFFLTPSEFASRLADDAFLEHATVYDRSYGTLRRPVEDALAQGRSIVLDIDVRGAAQVRERMPRAVFVFILPPDRETLLARLRSRGTDDEATIRRRMELADEQLADAHLYAHRVVNDDLSEATDALERVFRQKATDRK